MTVAPAAIEEARPRTRLVEVPPPTRSRDQRMEALKYANEIRCARAAFKAEMREGRRSIQDALKDPPAYLLTAKILDLLMAVPKIGQKKAMRILNHFRISPAKTLGGLSSRQRTELIKHFTEG